MPEVPMNNQQGGCACGRTRFAIDRSPLFVHCCHCRWCQRETGTAFALNALIEIDAISVTQGSPTPIDTPTESGRGQKILRCPDCAVALWSHYVGIGPTIAFLRVGVLDTAALCPPDIHIYTSSKQPWLSLSHDIPVVKEYYRRADYWPAESLERLKLAREGQGAL